MEVSEQGENKPELLPLPRVGDIMKGLPVGEHVVSVETSCAAPGRSNAIGLRGCSEETWSASLQASEEAKQAKSSQQRTTRKQNTIFSYVPQL